jgi:lipopolysaccharide biosynthesis glycosyltransferase
VLTRSSQPVSITPIAKNTFHWWKREGENNGATEFSFSRFLVPYLAGYNGHALFVDGADMLCLGDVAELWKLRDHSKAVQVVKHEPYQVEGTKMWNQPNRQYPKKNWSSVMLFNCAYHHAHELTPETVATKPGSWLHQFQWCQEHKVGALPAEWNVLVGHHEIEGAKILHFTNGLADVNPTDGLADNLWRKERAAMNHVTPK